MAYESTIQRLEKSHPHLTNVLKRAHLNRTDRLQQWAEGARLAGLDQWLGYLKDLEDAFRSEAALAPLAFLVRRIRTDYEAAIEATLGGLQSVVLDSMRDVMEIYMLFREFSYEPPRINEWLGSTEQELITKFSPKELRKKHSERLNVKAKDLAETADYRAHSRALHVSPTCLPWEERGIVAETKDEFLADMCYWEMFGHAESIAVVVTQLAAAIAPGKRIGPDVKRDLPKLADADERVSEMKQIYFALMEASVDSAEDL